MEIKTYTVNNIQNFITNLPQRHGYGLRNNMGFRGQPGLCQKLKWEITHLY